MRVLLADAGITVTDLRVRDLGNVARIELSAADLPAVQAVPGLEQAIATAGFTEAAIRYAGFSSGNLNNE